MPTYEYQCTECDYKFEEFQSMIAEAISVCPECKGKTRRLISGGAGFLFKGKGFYITDYRSKEYKKAAEKDKPSSSVTKTSSDKKKSESKSSTDSKKTN